MKLFAKPQTDDILPAGHDDPSSPFFVLEHLREAYLQQQPAGRRLLDRDMAFDPAARIASRDTLAELGGYPDIDPMTNDRRRNAELLEAQQAWKAARRARLDELLEHPTEELDRLVAHDDRLARAERQHTGDARRAEYEATRRAQETCPVCGVDEVARTGAIDRRPLIPGAGDTRRDLWLRSCGLCFTVAQQQVIETARNEQVPDGRTRDAAVRTAPRGTGMDHLSMPSGGGWDLTIGSTGDAGGAISF